MNVTNFLANLIIPLNLCITLFFIAAILFMLRWRRLAWGVALFSLAWGLFWSLPASSLWAGGRLEQFHPYTPPDLLPDVDAIVVLGGHTAGGRENWFEPYDPDKVTTRSDTAARLFKAGRAPFIILSGAALDGGVSEAQAMANALKRQDVPENALILEPESLTTRENGVLTARLIHERNFKEILLVTSALHMPRATAVFENLGVNVIPAPSPPQITVPDDPDFGFWLPDGRTFEAARSIIKEYAGLLVYWLRGWV